jgi:hypothetical protein
MSSAQLKKKEFISESRILEDSVPLFGDLSSSSLRKDMNLRKGGLYTDKVVFNGKIINKEIDKNLIV